MDCKSAHDLLPLYFDGELDRTMAREVEAHLDECGEARFLLIDLDALRSTLRADAPRYTAPAALRERIASELPRAAPVRMRRVRWFALAASWALAFVAGGTLLPMLWGSRGENNLSHDLFASHWRALAATSPVDVVSTDRHTVKPWFAGKISQAPVVQDFADRGFALVGGRIDYAGSERVAVLVYRHGQHLIDVFLLPPGASASAREQQGYALEPVMLGGQAGAMISDMDAAERAKFAQVLESAK